MDTTPSPDLVRAALAEQTLALAAEAATLTAADLAAPSALPGWSRGHVLAHVRLNAEAFVGVLGAAARGEVVSMYPGRAERDAAIEAAATDASDRQTAALLDSAERFTRAWAALPQQRYDVEFTSPAGWFQPAGVVGFFRWREVVLHRADLHPADAGHRSPVDVLAAAEPALVARLLAETCTAFAGRADVPALAVTATDLGTTWELHADGTANDAADGATTVSGPAAALAAWLTGRGSGTGLTSSGPLPALPAFA
ncbi:MAG: maleylpyruvate isomerase family mycothiol-dependent enzyme [Actinobacteria bacterium]|nr:maleylpyruvate isomerase family mycothiol-dependent enzyme [Actinomycetota bacterium]